MRQTLFVKSFLFCVLADCKFLASHLVVSLPSFCCLFSSSFFFCKYSCSHTTEHWKCKISTHASLIEIYWLLSFLNIQDCDDISKHYFFFGSESLLLIVVRCILTTVLIQFLSIHSELRRISMSNAYTQFPAKCDQPSENIFFRCCFIDIL